MLSHVNGLTGDTDIHALKSQSFDDWYIKKIKLGEEGRVIVLTDQAIFFVHKCELR